MIPATCSSVKRRRPPEGGAQQHQVRCVGAAKAMQALVHLERSLCRGEQNANAVRCPRSTETIHQQGVNAGEPSARAEIGEQSAKIWRERHAGDGLSLAFPCVPGQRKIADISKGEAHQVATSNAGQACQIHRIPDRWRGLLPQFYLVLCPYDVRATPAGIEVQGYSRLHCAPAGRTCAPAPVVRVKPACDNRRSVDGLPSYPAKPALSGACGDLPRRTAARRPIFQRSCRAHCPNACAYWRPCASSPPTPHFVASAEMLFPLPARRVAIAADILRLPLHRAVAWAHLPVA